MASLLVLYPVCPRREIDKRQPQSKRDDDQSKEWDVTTYDENFGCC